ncbi:MAG: ABC transporter permease [Clostridium sp.]
MTGWSTGYSLLAASTPAFWTAMVLLMVFAVYFKWFPIGLSVPIGVTAEEIALGDRIRHAVLPAAALKSYGDLLSGPPYQGKNGQHHGKRLCAVCQGRGESETSIVLRHGLRNVLIPAMTLQFASISEIIGGSVLVEQVFSYPGLGQAAVTAGLGSDVPLLLGITVVTAVLAASGNLAASVLYGIVDPRIRKEAAR